MSMISELEELGANVDDAMQRFMNKTALYEKMLGKLPPMLKEKPVLELIEAGNIDAAIENAHTLKGVLGNLSITPLYEGYSEVVNLLRKNDPEKAKSVLEGCFSTQEEVIACIEKYQ